MHLLFVGFIHLDLNVSVLYIQYFVNQNTKYPSKHHIQPPVYPTYSSPTSTSTAHHSALPPTPHPPQTTHHHDHDHSKPPACLALPQTPSSSPIHPYTPEPIPRTSQRIASHHLPTSPSVHAPSSHVCTVCMCINNSRQADRQTGKPSARV